MKLTTKLLLGATVVAGLSISAFAACATDVDFGGTKKITGLADGNATGDAVNMGQFRSAAFTRDDGIQSFRCDAIGVDVSALGSKPYYVTNGNDNIYGIVSISNASTRSIRIVDMSRPPYTISEGNTSVSGYNLRMGYANGVLTCFAGSAWSNGMTFKFKPLGY